MEGWAGCVGGIIEIDEDEDWGWEEGEDEESGIDIDGVGGATKGVGKLSGRPLNNATLYKFPSALMTASQPVSSKHLKTSDWKRMLPLANTGTETDRLTARIFCQSATPCQKRKVFRSNDQTCALVR